MEKVTNKTIIEKYKFGKNECVSWLISENKEQTNVPSKRSYEHLVDKTVTNFKKLKKNKTRDPESIQSFLDAEVIFPTAKTYLKKPKVQPHSCSCEYQNVSLDLANELNEIKKKIVFLEKEISQLKRSKTLRETLISAQRQLKEARKYYKRILETNRNIIRKKNLKIKSLRIQNTRLEDKVTKHLQFINTLLESSKENETEIQNLKQKHKENKQSLNDSLKENDWLREIVENDTGEHVTFHDNKFTAEIRQCIYSLLQFNVGASQVESVINCVLSVW